MTHPPHQSSTSFGTVSLWKLCCPMSSVQVLQYWSRLTLCIWIWHEWPWSNSNIWVMRTVRSFYVQITYDSVSSGGEFVIRFKAWFNWYIMDQVPSLRRLGRYKFPPYFRLGWKGGQHLIEISDPWKMWSNMIRFHPSLKKHFTNFLERGLNFATRHSQTR